ncbi:hypothetical protein VB738_13475 [Cyanobium gracile UHCC 0139]|uniref:ABC transporter substrate-binding protein n=1 Tax=Cyanobium gracile UHCC 0139 TaxID=3110308 RepID=A0ABU5RWU7_9CYAN|nr:hypothetical protein [Cyanobium gracile]MEA5392268.1 hypothetical protein [Cyanobium gracile UHCC 0139]
MIHLTVAAPMGIDSVFFSFIERLAVVNGHVCVDPPAQRLDEADHASWIDVMKRSNQHFFLIGYRYPPKYWIYLAQSSTTILLVADPDGVVRQLGAIAKGSSDPSECFSLDVAVDSIRPALEETISLASLMTVEGPSQSNLIAPAHSFCSHPRMAFSRVEQFFRDAGVDLSISCCDTFAQEAIPLIDQLGMVDHDTKQALQQLLLLDDSAPRRLSVVSRLFDYDHYVIDARRVDSLLAS